MRSTKIWMTATVATALLAVGCSAGGGGTSTGTLSRPVGAVAAQAGSGAGGGGTSTGTLSRPVGAVAAQAGSGNFPVTMGQPGPGVTVQGSGRVSGRPDTLTATVGVEVSNPDVQAAIDAANRSAQQVIDAVRKAGVAEEDIQTAQFDVNPQYGQTTSDGVPEIRGYTATNLLDVRITDLSTAGDVLGAATRAAGDNARVRNVRFSLEDNEQLVAAAREQAFKDAQARASEYAQLAGRNLGELISVSESYSPPVSIDRDFAGSADGAVSSMAVPIQPGQQEIAVSLTAVWALG